MNESAATEEMKQAIRDLAKTTQEVAEAQKKTELAQQKTELAQQKTELAQQEVAEAQKKTELAQQKTEQMQQKTQKNLDNFRQATEDQIKILKETTGSITEKWGAFIENLVEGNLLRLLKKRRIDVKRVVRNYVIENEKKEAIAEFDFIAANGNEVVVVEAKSTLSHNKIEEFIEKLEKFKNGIPFYSKEKKLYGAMAYLEVYERSKRGKKQKLKQEDSGERAMREGFWLIEAPGGEADFAKIVNPEGFKPKEF